MPHEVKVKTPIAYDPSVVAGALGETPLPLDLEDLVLAPFITVDGRIHGPTSDFLRRHCLTRPNLTTARRMASDLAKWVDYLCNDCGLAPFEDGRDPTFAATEDDFARYYRQRQYGSVDQVLTSQGWARAASTIKRYYENAQRVYQHPPPFEIQSFAHISGFTGTKIARYQPRRRSTGSAGVPLTPEFAELLLMGALRVDLNGQQDDYRGADRDHAILSLGLAAGLRRNNLANITTYEIPALSELPVTTMVVADRITKGDAGGDALVFTHRLRAVHGYIEGPRSDVVNRSRYTPSEPLEIVDANASTVRYLDRSTGEVTSDRWSVIADTERRRLVTPDGASAVLFLNEYTGAPLQYSSYQHAVAGARDFVRERINADFPARFRLHDLRHTYAVHMTLAILRDVIADAVPGDRREDWMVDRIANAVEMVKFSLGHASEASTQLYISTAHRFLGIPIGQFIGEGF